MSESGLRGVRGEAELAAVRIWRSRPIFSSLQFSIGRQVLRELPASSALIFMCEHERIRLARGARRSRACGGSNLAVRLFISKFNSDMRSRTLERWRRWVRDAVGSLLTIQSGWRGVCRCSDLIVTINCLRRIGSARWLGPAIVIVPTQKRLAQSRGGIASILTLIESPFIR